MKDLLGILRILNVRKCVRSCDVGEYLDYKKCKRRNKLADKFLKLLDIKAKSSNLHCPFPLICYLFWLHKIHRLHPMQLIQMPKQHFSLKNQTKAIF